MDIISHTLSGLTAATLIVPFSKCRLSGKILILCCGVAGGLFPDVDTVSLWSGFDRTIGAFFQLPINGQQVYFSNYWYSHHSFFHSIVSGLLFSLLLFLSLLGGSAMLQRIWPNSSGTVRFTMFCSLGFFLGYLAHLAGDLPTPGHSWGGIKLLWPLPHSFGGTGQIWWWNNYDIFLILAGCSLLNMTLIVLSQSISKQWLSKILVPGVVFGAVVLVSYQVSKRPVSFSYSGHTNDFYKNEQQAVDLQKDLLGARLYKVMRRFDQSIPLNF